MNVVGGLDFTRGRRVDRKIADLRTRDGFKIAHGVGRSGDALSEASCCGARLSWDIR